MRDNIFRRYSALNHSHRVAAAVSILVTALAAALGIAPREVLAQPRCESISLTGTGGVAIYSPMGQFYEFGIRCNPGDPFKLVLGGRWSELNPTVNPFGTLSYAAPLSKGWNATLAAGYRERLGDFEGHRLPELTLSYAGNGAGWVPTLELSAGSFQILDPYVRATRFGGAVGLQSPVGRLGSKVEAVVRLRAGGYTYNTGDSQSFYSGGVELSAQVGRNGLFSIAYDNLGGSGTSPILFDAPLIEQVATGRFTWQVKPDVTGMLSASVNLHTPTVEGREYVFEFRSAGGRYIGVLHRASDSRWFILFGF